MIDTISEGPLLLLCCERVPHRPPRRTRVRAAGAAAVACGRSCGSLTGIDSDRGIEALELCDFRNVSQQRSHAALKGLVIAAGSSAATPAARQACRPRCSDGRNVASLRKAPCRCSPRRTRSCFRGVCEWDFPDARDCGLHPFLGRSRCTSGHGVQRLDA